MQLESPFVKHLLQSCKKIIHKRKQFFPEKLCLKNCFLLYSPMLFFCHGKNAQHFLGSILIYPFQWLGNVSSTQKEMEMSAVPFSAVTAHLNK